MQIPLLILMTGLAPTAHLAMHISAPTSSLVAADTSLTDRVEAFVRPYVEENLWSGAVVIVRGDSVLHQSGYGHADIERGIPNTPATRFGVASVTKAFTAIAAARLRQEGALALDDTIGRWIPGFPGGDRITVSHLITHRSGIRNTDELDWYGAGKGVGRSLHELVDSLAMAGLEFEPGTRRKYSNGGYSVLAAVLSRATGLSYAEVLETQVFGPAGMPASGDLSDSENIKNQAIGYLLGPNGRLVAGPYVHPANKIGAGTAYTNVEDVVAFYRALRDGHLLPSSVRDSMFQPIASPIGVRRIYFGGRGPSYTAAIQIFLDEGEIVALVAALGNNYGRLNEEITDGLSGLLYGRWEDERVAQILARDLPFAGHPLPEHVLDELEGRYRHEWGFEFRLEREGPWQLVYVDGEHGTRTPMIAQSENRLISPWQWAELQWDQEDGEASWRWLDFPAQSLSVERLISEPDPGPR